MSDHARFRDAATVHVDAPVDHVRELISHPDVLAALDERLAGEDVEILVEEDRVEVWAETDGLHMAFRLREEGESTRLAALEDVEPAGLVEKTKWMFFPGRAHRDLEEELDTFSHTLETLETASSA